MVFELAGGVELEVQELVTVGALVADAKLGLIRRVLVAHHELLSRVLLGLWLCRHFSPIIYPLVLFTL